MLEINEKEGKQSIKLILEGEDGNRFGEGSEEE
jgi:hypothetical protein